MAEAAQPTTIDKKLTGMNNALTGIKPVVVIGSLILLLMIAMYSIFGRAYFQAQQAADRAAIEDADKFLRATVAYRNFYTKLVVPRVRAIGGSFTHDYLNEANSLPLPATFAKDFGEFISANRDTEVRLYSDLPFPWRGATGGARDDFEREAMVAARANPETPFWRIEVRPEGRVLRYAIADVLQDSCIGCHNSYPGTPKTDWKVGDVRGVFEISRPLTITESLLQDGYRELAVQLVLLGSSIFLLLTWLLLRFKRMVRLEHERFIEVEVVNERLQDELIVKEQLSDRIQAEEQKLHAIFESVNDVIILIDAQGMVRQVNSAISQLLGYQEQELLGQNVKMIVPEPHASAHDEYLRRYLSSGQAHIIGYGRQLKARHKNGTHVDIELSVSEVLVGEQRYFAGVMRDISLRLAAEKALKDARDKAIENVRMKSQFLTNISHELRTPLNGMIGMSHLLEERLNNVQDQEYARIIHQSAQQLLSVVSDILDFSALESARFVLNPQPFSVQSWLYDTLAVHVQNANQKGLALAAAIESGVPATLVGDAARLSQILNKLISNAIKFTASGQVTVTMSVGATSLTGVEVIFAVKDTGIGISESGLSQLFQAFSQLDGSSTRAYGGNGLGLAISRQLAVMMQGDIEVSSTPGAGSLFTVRVVLSQQGDELLTGVSRQLTEQSYLSPTQSVVAVEVNDVKMLTDAERSDQKESSDEGRFMNLLLVEDNLVNQKVALALLKRLGHQVDIANHGQECLDKLAQGHYDAVIMDCQMPVMDGYQATRAIREIEAAMGGHIPVIALTAHAMKGDEEKCYDAGMDDYLTKPINHGLLKERLEYWQNWIQAQKSA